MRLVLWVACPWAWGPRPGLPQSGPLLSALAMHVPTRPVMRTSQESLKEEAEVVEEVAEGGCRRRASRAAGSRRSETVETACLVSRIPTDEAKRSWRKLEYK